MNEPLYDEQDRLLGWSRSVAVSEAELWQTQILCDSPRWRFLELIGSKRALGLESVYLPNVRCYIVDWFEQINGGRDWGDWQ